MEDILKKEVRLKELNEFISTTFSDAVFEFNGACGKNPHTVPDVASGVQMLINETKRVIEESQESIKAYLENDRAERLDGVVDVYWTNVQLTNIHKVIGERFGQEKVLAEITKLPVDEKNLLVLAQTLATVGLRCAVGDKINGNAIVAGAIRVIKNNTQKYTKDKAVADDWAKHIDTETQAIKEYEFNGETFYCIKRLSDDYIVKPYTFKPVELTDL